METWREQHRQNIERNAHPVVEFTATVATYVMFGGAAIGATGMVVLVLLAALGIGR